MNSVQPILSGVAIGAGLQSIVVYVNLRCYYLVGIPFGLVLGYVINLQELSCKFADSTPSENGDCSATGSGLNSSSSNATFDKPNLVQPRGMGPNSGRSTKQKTGENINMEKLEDGQQEIEIPPPTSAMQQVPPTSVNFIEDTNSFSGQQKCGFPVGSNPSEETAQTTVAAISASRIPGAVITVHARKGAGAALKTATSQLKKSHITSPSKGSCKGKKGTMLFDDRILGSSAYVRHM